jgi:heat shock protein HslJ
MKFILASMFGVAILVSCSGNKSSQKPETKPAASAKTLENTYWVLTELEGKPVAAAKEGSKPNFIYFNATKKRVSVSGGCNIMGGSYELMDGNRIKFSQMMSTMMACPDMAAEDGLRRMTEMVDNYAISGDNLSFAKARMAPMARFKAAPIPDGMKFD